MNDTELVIRTRSGRWDPQPQDGDILAVFTATDIRIHRCCAYLSSIGQLAIYDGIVNGPITPSMIDELTKETESRLGVTFDDPALHLRLHASGTMYRDLVIVVDDMNPSQKKNAMGREHAGANEENIFYRLSKKVDWPGIQIGFSAEAVRNRAQKIDTRHLKFMHGPLIQNKPPLSPADRVAIVARRNGSRVLT